MKKILKYVVCFVLLFTNLISVHAQNTQGTIISKNTNFTNVKTDYQVTFNYQNNDNSITSVALIGDFQFYKSEDVTKFKNGDNSYRTYTPFEYEEGMVNASYDISTQGKQIPLEMTKQDDIYTIQIPLPGNLYAYAYQITYSDGSVKKELDPTNLPFTASNGKNCGWSLLYVGSATDCLKGQEYIYPRKDGKKGEIEYLSYTTSYGVDELIPVYTPYNYDETKTYKTLYLNGSEYDWFFIGSANNIIDNLIAEGELDECLVVGTNVISPFYVDAANGYKIGVENTVNKIIPLIESRYNVSKKAEDRAICGLSANGASVHTLLGMYPDEFGYYAAFSSGPENVELNSEILNNKVIFETSGNLDFCANNTQNMLSTLDGLGIGYYYSEVDGAHDFGCWRESLTLFAKKYLWNTDNQIIEGNINDAYDEIKTPIKQENGKTKEYALSNTLRSHLLQENLLAVKDDTNKTLTIDQQLNGVFLSSNYINGKSEAGISYYNMLNFYATLLQTKQMLEANQGYKIVDSQGKEYDLDLINEFIGLVKQINDFDPTTNLKYDWKSAYDTEEFRNETQRGGVDVIATSKEGHISFEFHIDSHGWWGYDLGAHDSITGLVLGYDDETAKEQQHDLTLKYGQFFVIEMGSDNKGTWYMLNTTDLENPVIYVSKDKKEAFMIDVDMYGAYAINDVIKSVIGEECTSLNIFLTHNHGDHINNLAVIGQDEGLRKKTTIYWPENEPHATLTAKDGTVEDMIGKDVVSDIQWKEVKTLKDMEKFTAAGVEFQFIEIPNEHTVGGGQLADLKHKVIYNGDTLGAQIHLGGTTVKADNAQSWLDGAKKSAQYVEENNIKYGIGGHTPYLNTPKFASWLATAIEYGMKNASEGYNLIIVENGQVVNGTDRFGEIMGQGLTDREELNICSLGYIKPAPENPTDPTPEDPNNPQKPVVSDTDQTNSSQTDKKINTGDTTNIQAYAITFMLSAAALFILLRKKKITR